MFTGYETLNNNDRKILSHCLGCSLEYVTDTTILIYAKCWKDHYHFPCNNRLWDKSEIIAYKLEALIKEKL
jgi:hypothetical protein